MEAVGNSRRDKPRHTGLIEAGNVLGRAASIQARTGVICWVRFIFNCMFEKFFSQMYKQKWSIPCFSTKANEFHEEMVDHRLLFVGTLVVECPFIDA